MQIHDLVQGTPEWHQFRLEHFGASEASAMLGLSKKVKRTELMHMKFTCLPKEFSEWVQENILDYGHEVEALARPIVERILGEDLYPVTCSEGNLSASCDGLTMSEEIGFEHKQFNQSLFDSVSRNELPDEFMAQPQQCMLVTGAKKWLFCVSDGTEQNMASMWVYPDQTWFDRIKAGWNQFENDLASYVPVRFAEKPEAKAVIELPALFLQAEGRLVNSNMEAFGAALAVHLAETRQMVYVTDQDFADAEKRSKMYRETCNKLTLTKQSMLSQTVSIDEAFRMIDTWHEDLRTTALQIEKDVKKNKESKQLSIISDAKIEFSEFVNTLEKGIAPVRLNYTAPNFSEAIKGKRLFSAMHDAVQTMLANTKIELSQAVAGINANLKWLKNHDEFKFLFNDLQTIVYKQSEDFQLLINSRIAEHQKREAEKLEAERARIRVEEEAKAKAAQDKINADAEAQREAASTLLSEQATVKVVYPSLTTEIAGISASVTSENFTPNTDKPTLTLGSIGARLGFSLTADFMCSIGFEPARREHSSVLYHEDQWNFICKALIAHIENVRKSQQQAA